MKLFHETLKGSSSAKWVEFETTSGSTVAVRVFDIVALRRMPIPAGDRPIYTDIFMRGGATYQASENLYDTLQPFLFDREVWVCPTCEAAGRETVLHLGCSEKHLCELVLVEMGGASR